ncbi:MAG: Fe-S cluster assembly protein SufD [Alphaproteobacteria bacterium]|nr:Fe-S cluster assembly protein SufD [Alphaproteobacteria bacterium]
MSLESLIRQSRTQKELWRYTPLNAFEIWKLDQAKPANIAGLPQARTAHRIVFVNGFLDESATTLHKLPDALLSFSQKDNIYTLALGGQACLVMDPVELLFLYDETKDAQTRTQLAVNLGANSRLTLLERHKSQSAHKALHERDLAITLEAGAKLTHAHVIDEGQKTFHNAQTQITLAQGAFYHGHALMRGGLLNRQMVTADLCEPSARASFSSLILGRAEEHHDITTFVRHKAAHTTSMQKCRAVLSDNSCGVFKGTTHLAPAAQKTSGHQMARALLLSENASFDARPELEIYADDVKCSHGASTGALDEAALFYLRSRGIPEDEARAMLTRAFIQSFLEDGAEPAIMQLMQEEIASWTC